jgi:hypothetical protein
MTACYLAFELELESDCCSVQQVGPAAIISDLPIQATGCAGPIQLRR